MDDRQIVSGVRRGDRDAVAALYDTYADVLHDFARRRADSDADAADVVHDAFLVAVERIAQLRDPDRLRPWLYAIARTELHRRYRHAARYAELDPDRHDPVSPEVAPDVQVARREIVALVREATEGLADDDREILDLHLRHGLVGADLAAAAGLPARHASVVLERVKSRLARTIGVVLLSRQPACAEFASIKAGQVGGLTPLARKRLARHVDKCVQCTNEQSRRMRPEVLLAALPIIPAPPALRHRLVAQSHPAPQWQVWDAAGFPWLAGDRRSRRRWPVLASAVAIVVALLIGGAFAARPLLRGEPGLAVGLAESTTRGPAPTPRTTTPAGDGVIQTAAVPTTTVEPTTTSPPVPTTTTSRPPPTTTTRPPPPPTTTTTTTPPPPRDQTGPTIGTPTMSPAYFAATTDRSYCPGLPTVGSASVPVSDPSGVKTVSISWTFPATGEGGSSVVGPDPDGTYSLALGPVVGANLLYYSYHPLSATITAVDGNGNTSSAAARFPRAVYRCGYTIR